MAVMHFNPIGIPFIIFGIACIAAGKYMKWKDEKHK